MKNAFRIIDLFAGIGGFHLAIHNLGGTCVFASESDKFARKTYLHNFNKISPCLFELGNFAGDITQINPYTIPNYDILCAGFPCQPFSQAGLKMGFDDTRGTMFFNIAKIIEVTKPSAFFLENVQHLLRHNEGKTFGTIKRIIEDKLGYTFFYKVIRASDFGLPQHRPRLFMIGFKDRSADFKFPDPIPLKMTMSDIFNGRCERDIGFTIRVCGRRNKIDSGHNWDAYWVDGEIRRLTPRECLKMQGFPENFEFPVSNTQAMKQIGNSVAIPAIQAVAKEIISELAKLNSQNLALKSVA